MPHLLGKGSARFGVASIISAGLARLRVCALTAFLEAGALMGEVNTDGRQSGRLNTAAVLWSLQGKECIYSLMTCSGDFVLFIDSNTH